MDIQRIDSISILVNNSYSRTVQDFPRPKAEFSKDPWIKAPDHAKEIAPHFSDAAVRLQQMDQQFDLIGKTASSLKEEIITMQRTLPPFPPGSQERVRLLKSYIGLRKLIEQLTIPREVPFIRIKEEIALPEISNQATDQEWEAAVWGLEKTQEVILQKKTSLETGIRI
jgi:hypothetical protein